MRKCLWIIPLLFVWATFAPAAMADGTGITFQVQLTDNGSASYSGNLTLIAGIGSGTAISTQVLATIPFDVLAEPNPPQTFTYTSDDLPVGTSTIYAAIGGSDQFGSAIYGYPSGQTPVPPPPATPSYFTVFEMAGPVTQYAAISVGDSDPFQIGEATITGTVTPTPEPGSGGLMLIGIGLLGLMTVARNPTAGRASSTGRLKALFTDN